MMETALIAYIVNALWQAPLLASGAWLFVRTAHPAPQAQHRLWLAVLALAVLLPMHSSPMIQTNQAQTMGQPGRNTEAIPEELQSPIPAALSTNEQTWFRRSLPFLPRMHDIHLTADTTHWLVGLYLSTVVFGLLRIAHGWRTARHLVKDSSPAFLGLDRASLAYYTQRFRVELPQVRESRELSSPVVVGAATPVLLVPAGFARITQEELRAVVCHELAHIKRHDYAVNLACQIAALPLIWHPVMHHIQQRIRLTREMVCDALAAQELESDLNYARCLLALANSMLGGHTIPHHAHLPGLFSKNTLEERVMRLTETTILSARARFVRVASGAAIMLASCAAAAFFHLTPTMAARATLFPIQATEAAPVVAPAQADAPKAPSSPAARSASHSEQKKKNAERQAEKARATVNSPEFKKQIEAAQQEALKATEHNSPLLSSRNKWKKRSGRRQKRSIALLSSNR